MPDKPSGRPHELRLRRQQPRHQRDDSARSDNHTGLQHESDSCHQSAGVRDDAQLHRHGNFASAIDGVGNLTTYSWDSLNNLTAIVDGLGNTTTFGYVTSATTNIRRLSSVTQPPGGIFTYSYDSNDRVTSLTDQLGKSTTLIWNAAGYRIAAVDALGNRTSYTFNSVGQLASVQNPLGSSSRPFTIPLASKLP